MHSKMLAPVSEWNEEMRANPVTAFWVFEWYGGRVVTPELGEDQMGTILMIMSVPFLYATGIYNPPVVQQGRCIAEPGTFDALFCMGRTEAPPKKYRAR